MGKIRFWINRYFGFSRHETNGLFLLLLITLLAATAPFLFDTTSSPQDFRRDQAMLDSLVAKLDVLAQQEKQAREASATRKVKRVQALKKFNPNILTQEQFQALGLSFRVATNILKYRQKAGGFRYKEQLARIYGMPPDLYRELFPFIDLPSRQQEFPAASGPPTQRPFALREKKARERLSAFDINQADTLQLKKIRGIGSTLSLRIIRFRDKLGGFIHKEQLREVYGLSPEVVDSLHKYVFVSEAFTPRQLALNTATLEELRAHPYLSYQTARLILAYRTQHGSFQNLEELSNIRQISESQLTKLRPYLHL